MSHKRTTRGPKLAQADAIASTNGGPLRRCIVTGAILPKEQLVRFVVSPEGRIVPDVTGRLPGRGLWVTASAGAVAKACAKSLFAKAARGPVRVDCDLPDRLADLLARRALDLLGIANSAGLVVAGAAKAEAALARGEAAALVQATDGSEREGRSMASAALRTHVPVIRLFSATELGLALGRENVVHAAVREGRLTRQFLNEAQRLGGFRNAAAGAGT